MTHLAPLALQAASPLLLPLPPELGGRALLVRVGLVRHRKASSFDFGFYILKHPGRASSYATACVFIRVLLLRILIYNMTRVARGAIPPYICCLAAFKNAIRKKLILVGVDKHGENQLFCISWICPKGIRILI